MKMLNISSLQRKINYMDNNNFFWQTVISRDIRRRGLTCENNKVRVLITKNAIEKIGGVEVGAGGFLAGENIEAAGRSAVSIVHIGHLENFELTALFAKPQPLSSRRHGSSDQEEEEVEAFVGRFDLHGFANCYAVAVAYGRAV
jgi:hypothetical protein